MKKIISVVIVIGFFFEISISLERMVDNPALRNFKEQIDLPRTVETKAEEKLTNIVEGRETDIIKEKLEILTEQNEFEDFYFIAGENAICIYEGMTESDTVKDKFALYKETIGKDIVFMNMLFTERETEKIYSWKGEELVQIGTMKKIKSEQVNNPETKEEKNIIFENMTQIELLDRVMEILKQMGCDMSFLIYDGTVEFINRDYYMVSAFNDFQDHIIREQGYYIDIQNGKIYCMGENSDFLRTELYYIGNLQ